MPIACLALAGLVAFALVRARGSPGSCRSRSSLLALDLHVRVLRRLGGGSGEHGLRRDRGAGAGARAPVFLRTAHYGSVYTYYDQQARRERPGGYSTLAPQAADTSRATSSG